MPEPDPTTLGGTAEEAGTATKETAEGTAPPGPSTSESPASGEVPGVVGGTVPPWWTWVGEHRKPVAVVAALVLVAVVGTVVAVSVSRQSPGDVVRSYLDAIRSGDTQAALEIAGEPDGGNDSDGGGNDGGNDDGNDGGGGDRLRFLSSDALADGWSVDAVVERNVRETQADVDVTFRAGEVSKQGRFSMTKDGDSWTMESPFVKVDLAVGDLDVVELGDVRQPVRLDQTTQAVPLLLFPGVYELYPGFADRITVDQRVLVAVPTDYGDSAVRVTASYTLTDAAADTAQEAVNASVDACAAQAVTRPPGCPFDVSEETEVLVLDEVGDVKWTVRTHPEAYFARGRNGSGVHLVLRKPGVVTVTGTGVPQDGAARTPFTLTCEFGVDNLSVVVTEDGIDISNATGNDYSAAVATKCF